jgi:hypothetical protein
LLLQSLHPVAMAGEPAAFGGNDLWVRRTTHSARARIPLLLAYFPPVELTVVRTVGRTLVGGIRWALPGAG